MSENDKIDDLFRANSDYLANEPHRDFNPEAFWQQLRPELAQPKRKIAGWWWASAAAVLLALLAGGVWWVQSGGREAGNTVAEKPAVIQPEKEIETPPLSEPAVRLEEILPESRVVLKRTPNEVKPELREEIKASEPSTDTPLTPGPGAFSEEVIVVNTTIPEQKEVKPTSETSPPRTDKPRYRIVHLNEIQPQKEQKSQNRPQVALRIGVAGASAPKTAEPNIPLSIPINN